MTGDIIQLTPTQLRRIVAATSDEYYSVMRATEGDEDRAVRARETKLNTVLAIVTAEIPTVTPA